VVSIGPCGQVFEFEVGYGPTVTPGCDVGCSDLASPLPDKVEDFLLERSQACVFFDLAVHGHVLIYLVVSVVEGELYEICGIEVEVFCPKLGYWYQLLGRTDWFSRPVLEVEMGSVLMGVYLGEAVQGLVQADKILG
jgi:hypothetical protein